MLYDNAQLARVYLHAWQLTGHEFYRTIALETLDYVVHEMRGPEGAFYSTQDADSEGVEGKFFVWTPDEIRKVLGGEGDGVASEFLKAYGVKPGGNWEGKNILELTGSLEQRAALADARAKLFAVREARVHPNHDEKVLTSWNGLMLAAFAEAARALDRGDYRQVAECNTEFLLRELRQKEVAIVGEPDAADTQALLKLVRDGYRPFQVVALGALDTQSPSVPLLQDRGQLDGRATAYVCQAFACQAPVTKPAKLQAQLAPR